MISLEHIHPILVHFPIVFILTLATFDLIATLRGAPVTGRSAIGSVSAGLAVLAGAFAVVTYFFGDMALEIAEGHGFHSEIAEIHEGLGTTTAVVFGIWALVRAFLWWRDTRLTGGVAAIVPVLEVLGAALVVATAYYGGQLVYDLGVNVGHVAG